MGQSRSSLQAFSGTTMRRLRNTPSYFFLIWRWTMWLYALVVILNYDYDPLRRKIGIILLVVTLLQTLFVTLYAPFLYILVPRLTPPIPLFMQKTRRISKRSRPMAEDAEADILTPLASTRNVYWDIIIYSIDLLICGFAMYYGGALGNPPFGAGSVFYRYGISTVFAAAFAYRYRGGLTVALGYNLFVILGIFVPPPGAIQHVADIIDILGSLIDVPLVALLAAYVATLLSQYAQSKRREQDNVRRQQALVHVSETLLRGAHDIPDMLQKSVAQIRQGGHFQRLALALFELPDEEQTQSAQDHWTIHTYAEDTIPGEFPITHNKSLLQEVAQHGKPIITFERLPEGNGQYGIARLYIPFFKGKQVQMVLGAESIRQTHFSERQERFLTISGTQLLVTLDNIRLTEETIKLAAAAERGRIAREIHDGIAQLVYMLSLSAETCVAQANRIAEASEEDAELLLPLAQRLEKLVTISKQALWETRNYMFNLKPLMSGSTTLPQMLKNQLREFETISGLSTQLEVTSDGDIDEAHLHSRRYAQVGTAIFRIVQEALTNAYKHAEATRILVYLAQCPTQVEVEVRDNGHGLPSPTQLQDAAQKHLYSGYGLQGMRERAEELGGTFEITQIPDSGIRIYASIPI